MSQDYKGLDCFYLTSMTRWWTKFTLHRERH